MEKLRDTTSSGDAPAERRSQQVRGIPSTDTDSLSNRGQRAPSTSSPPGPCSDGQRRFCVRTVRFDERAMRCLSPCARLSSSNEQNLRKKVLT